MAVKQKMYPNVMTPFGVASFPNLATARINESAKKDPNAKAKFSVLIAFPRSVLKKYGVEQKKQLVALKEAAFELFVDHFNGDRAKAEAAVSGTKYHWPFRNQDDEDADSSHQWEPGTVWIQPSNTRRPGCVNRFPGKDNLPIAIPVEEVDSEIYAGCIIRANVRPFWFENSGNKGVSFSLNGVQKIDDGERIDGRKSASEMFADYTDDRPAAMTDEDEDEDERPAPAKKRAAPAARRARDEEDEDEAPAPKKQPKRPRVEEEDEEEEAPAPKKRAAMFDDDAEDEDETEASQPPSTRKKRNVW